MNDINYIKSRVRENVLDFEEREEDPNTVDVEDPTDRGKDRGVDPSMTPLVDFLNNNGYNTIACCSGVLDEHYNLDNMREEVTIEEFTYYINNTETSVIRQPWVRIEPRYHNMSAEDNIKVDQQYFDMKKSLKYTTYIGDESCSGSYWELKTEIESEGLLYTISFSKDVCNTTLHRSDTYKEYDKFIRQAIQTLLESLYRFVQDGRVPDTSPSIYGIENFKTIQDSEIPNVVQL